ncbi:hypothetical protein ACJX0J_021063 [Zea mays]
MNFGSNTIPSIPVNLDSDAEHSVQDINSPEKNAAPVLKNNNSRWDKIRADLVKIMIWAGIVVITFAIAVRIYPIFIFLLKERIKPLEVSLSRYWDRLIDFLDRYLWACAQMIQTGIRKQKGEFVVTFSCHVKKRLYARAIEVGIHLSLLSNLFWILKTTLAVGYRLL